MNPTPRLAEAMALYHRHEYRAAMAVLGEALAAQPEDAVLWNLAGACASALGLPDDAERFWRSAIAARPDHGEAHYNLGQLLQKARRFDEAEAAYRRTLELQPKHIEALHNLGILLQECNRYTEAEAAYRREIAAGSRNPGAYNNLGVVLQKSNRLHNAEEYYRQALAIKPDHAEALNGIGNLLVDLHRRYDEAESCLRQAAALHPDGPYPRWNLSLLLLASGKFEEGWPLYEARYESFNGRREVDAVPPAVTFPQWRGESLAGKSLLVWHEQGFGDMVQFCRYVPLLKAQGVVRVSLVCKRPLVPLLKTLPGVDAVYAADGGHELPPHDYWTFPLSIPLYCRTTLASIPATLPYLAALPEYLQRWQHRLPRAGLKIGLVWKGSTTHGNDANRSLPGLSMLAPLWRVGGDIAFVSLQKDAGEEEALHPPADQLLTQLGTDIQDFADTAAIIGQLDLVICVDTAIAHVAGALNKPCWLLLPCFGTDWRWLRGRSDSPWYPGVVRLFRQSRADDWAAVIEEVALALKDAVSKPNPDFRISVS